MRVYTNEQLTTMKTLPVYYGGDLRVKNKAIELNGFIISNIEKINIENNLIILRNCKNKEVLRAKLSDISKIRINREFGEYRIIK